MVGVASDLTSTGRLGSRYQPILEMGEVTLELNLTHLTHLQGRLDFSIFCSYDFCALSLSLVPQPREVLLCAVEQVLWTQPKHLVSFAFHVPFCSWISHSNATSGRKDQGKLRTGGKLHMHFLSEKPPLLYFGQMEALPGI